MRRTPALDRARRMAFRQLAFMDRTESEVRTKLTDSGFADDLIDQVIVDFRERGYINDGQYALSRVRHMAVNKLYGDRLIERRLMGKGISRDHIRQAITEFRKECPEARTLEDLIRKKLKSKPVTDLRERKNLAQGLLRMGFTPSLIYEMLDRFVEDYRHDDDSE
ncbi:MAG: regulatory protein RecX [Syntrophales bacterium]|nr:regulatory protein RecX [Syntrophales bacterium]